MQRCKATIRVPQMAAMRATFRELKQQLADTERYFQQAGMPADLDAAALAAGLGVGDEAEDAAAASSAEDPDEAESDALDAATDLVLSTLLFSSYSHYTGRHVPSFQHRY